MTYCQLENSMTEQKISIGFFFRGWLRHFQHNLTFRKNVLLKLPPQKKNNKKNKEPMNASVTFQLYGENLYYRTDCYANHYFI